MVWKPDRPEQRSPLRLGFRPTVPLVALLTLTPAVSAQVLPIEYRLKDPPATPAAPLSAIRTCDRDSGSGDIVVCGRGSETAKHRVPLPPDIGKFDPNSETKSVSRERNGLFNVGDSGVASCSSVGPGGMYGCDFKAFKRWVEQHRK